MALDAVRTTLSIATMIGAAVKERAGELAGGVLEIPGVGPSAVKALELGGQASVLAEELTALLSTNRSAITDVLRAEIGLQLQRVGLSTSDTAESSRTEIDRLKAEVADLRNALAAASATSGRTTANPRSGAGITATAKPSTTRSSSTAATKRAAAKKSTVRPATPAKPAVKKAATSKTAVKNAATSTTAAKKAAAKKSTATKAAVKKPAAEKVSPQTSVIGKATGGAPERTTTVAPTQATTASREGTDTSYADLERDA